MTGRPGHYAHSQRKHREGLESTHASRQRNNSPFRQPAPDRIVMPKPISDDPRSNSGSHRLGHRLGHAEAHQASHDDSTRSPALRHQAGPSASRQQDSARSASNHTVSQADASAADNISLPPPQHLSPIHQLPGALVGPPPPLPGAPPRPPPALPAPQVAWPRSLTQRVHIMTTTVWP